MGDAVRDETIGRVTAALGAEPDVVLAIVFGSVARGEAGFGSGADVAVLMRGPMTSERREALIRALAAVTGRPVDLIDLREAGVPRLRTILREGRTLVSRDRVARDRLVSRMLTDVEVPLLVPARNVRSGCGVRLGVGRHAGEALTSSAVATGRAASIGMPSASRVGVDGDSRGAVQVGQGHGAHLPPRPVVSTALAPVVPASAPMKSWRSALASARPRA